MTVIARLQVENYKRITAVEIIPGEGETFIPIIGDNEQGKTSLLDAIVAAIGGKSYMPSHPVRVGEDEGAVRIELSNGLVVRRIFDAEGGGSIVVESADGARYPSPQAVLDKLYTSVAFDPISFTRLEPKKQLEALRRLVTLDVDVDALRAANKDDYDARRDVNRDVVRLQAEVDRLDTPDMPGQRPAQVDEAAIVAELQGAAETNAGIERRRAGRVRAQENLERYDSDIADLERRIAELQEQLQTVRTNREELATQIESAEPLPDLVDTTDVARRLEEARATNALVGRFDALAVAKINLEREQGRSEAFTKAMEEREGKVAKAFQNAKMPVEGLSFGENEVLFNGLPLAQASAAQQLRISTAIGMAQAPDLRVMLVRDASLLDKKGYALLAQMAAEAQPEPFQFWVEAVADGEKVGIIMEAGAVAGAPAPAPIDKGARRKKADKSGETAAKSAGNGPPEPESLIDGPEVAEGADGAPGGPTAENDAPWVADAQEQPVQLQPEPEPEPEAPPQEGDFRPVTDTSSLFD